MNDLLALVPLLAPLGLSLAALLAYRDLGPRPVVAKRVTGLAAGFALLVAVVTAGLTAWSAPLTSPLLGLGGVGLSVRLDGLSAVMLVLVAVLGAAVVHFSRTALDGDERQGPFLADLCLTVACVMVLVLSGNLAQLVFGWVATSLALHRLLRFYADRPGAVVAARKKFLVARVGDVALVVAAGLLVKQFGSTDLGVVLSGAAALGQAPMAMLVAAGLIGVAAVLKAAQFPTHGWLMEMQETPTPVSALLHAGILNGGTFLVVRLASVVQLAPAVLSALVLVGGFTALFASVLMVTESRVKATLAASSAAHMGFMLMLCGLGAFPVAIAHLVAHSVYKAHAFLSAGSTVEVARASRVPNTGSSLTWWQVLGSVLVAAMSVWATGAALGVSVFGTPSTLALGVVMTLALTQLMAQGAAGEFSLRLAGQTALAVVVTALAFHVLERAGAAVLVGAAPEAHLLSGVQLGVVWLVVGA